MDKLKGPAALDLMIKKFSDSCGVVRCILDFYKTMSQAEEVYAGNICRLTKSGTQFRSTFVMKLLDMEPHQELQSLKQGWHSLGQQLDQLAEHHREKAKNYLNEVRKPLFELLPQLEEKRRRLKVRTAELTEKLDMAQRRHTAAKKRYFELGDKCQKVEQDLERARTVGSHKQVLQLETKRAQLVSEAKKQKERYLEAVTRLQEEHASFDECAAGLIKEIQSVEVKRIQTVADSIRDFTKVLSNTCPIYLEGMQKIYLSVEEISAEMDVQGFAEDHKDLMQEAVLPQFVPHAFMSQMMTSLVGASPPAMDMSQESGGSEQDNASTDPQLPHPHPCDQSAHEKPTKRPHTSDHAATSKDSPVDETDLSFRGITARLPDPSPEETGNADSVPHMPAELHHQAEGRSQHHPDSNASLPKLKPLVKPKPATSKPKAPSPSPSERSSSQKELPAACVMKGDPPPLSPVVAEGVDTSSEPGRLLTSLLHQARENDYYSLLGAAPSAEESELARCRRERNQELHPDHIVHDPERRQRSEQRLSYINQAYTDVLKPESTRRLYNNLCSFRKSYSKLLTKSPAELEVARDKLTQLHRSLKKCGVPGALLSEVDLALQLVHLQLNSSRKQ